ncbi:MAG TPA: helix-turn-helix domain-containing protein [Gemmatimonadales bacterium]|nr:helix-turn-helix domain-containing protein [Gemmatimonadales bacterium]
MRSSIQIKSRRAERTEETAAALVRAAAALFVRRGYEETQLSEIARRARVTTGAIYHHFEDKKALFRAVAEEITRRFALAARDASRAERDPWRRLLAGIERALDASAAPEVKLAFLEAPVVLGLDAWREIELRETAPVFAEAFQVLVASGELSAPRAELLGRLLRGMVVEAAMAVAEAEDPDAAKRELRGMVRQTIEAFAHRSLAGEP